MNRKFAYGLLAGFLAILCIAAMPTSVNFNQFGSGGVLYLTNNWLSTNGVFRGTNQFQTIQVTNGAGAGKVLTDVSGNGVLSLQSSAGGTVFNPNQFATNSSVVSLIDGWVSTNGSFYKTNLFKDSVFISTNLIVSNGITAFGKVIAGALASTNFSGGFVLGTQGTNVYETGITPTQLTNAANSIANNNGLGTNVTLAGLTTVSNLTVTGVSQIGVLSGETNAGVHTFYDVPVTSGSTAGTTEGYDFKLDGITQFSIRGTSDGAGTITNYFASFPTNTFTAGTNTASSVVASNNVRVLSLTANRAVVSDASKNLTSSATTDTQVGYLSTTTNDVQTQLNGKGYIQYANTNGIFTTNVLAATEYQIIPTGGIGTTNIAANYFSQGQVLELEFEGNMNDDAGSVSPTYRVYLGATKIAEFGSGSWSSGPENFTITTKLSCFRSGATGSIRAVTKFLSEDPSAHAYGERYIVADYANTSFDTTAAYGIRVTVEFDAGIASPKITETKMVTIKGY